MPEKSIVYIICLMGSGKTTAGRSLARYLGWDFIDLDESITSREGKPISSIFSESGEEYFRELETDTLRNLQILNNTVVSTGGGAPCSPGNLNFMKETGFVVYLKKTPGQLLGHLSRDAGKRPLLKDYKDDGLLNFINDKLSEREQFYNMADLTITGMDVDIPDLVFKIQNAQMK